MALESALLFSHATVTNMANPTTQPKDPTSTTQYAIHPEDDGYLVGADGTVWTRKSRYGYRSEWKALSARSTRDGYLVVKVRLNGKQCCRAIHRLTLEAFVGPRPSIKHVTRHLDGCRKNNNIDNLCWGTYLENEADKVRHGTKPLAERTGNGKLSDDQVVEILALIKSGSCTKTEIANRYGVSKSLISHFANNKQVVRLERIKRALS